MSQPPQSGTRPVNALTTVSAPSHQGWLEQTLQLALTHRQQGGRPFAALLVRDNQLVASAVNRMLEKILSTPVPSTFASHNSWTP